MMHIKKVCSERKINNHFQTNEVTMKIHIETDAAQKEEINYFNSMHFL